MAPQQNSTLIDENLGDCLPSLLSIPEEISRCSPILPLRNRENLDKNNNANNYNRRNACKHNQDVNFILKRELAEKEERHYHKHKHYQSGSYRSSHSRRSRSISLNGVNSTVEQGHKEILIFLDDEPRYVSGITNKTTCNDIIKALIDDEISNGNYKYCQLHKDGTASRDYSDYVITECWRGIERSYDGNMAILPVWLAWSRVQNEIRLSLKHHKTIQDPVQILKTNTTLSSIRDYICKFLRFGRSKKRTSKSRPSVQIKNIDKEIQAVANDIPLLYDNEKKFVESDLKENCAKNRATEMKTTLNSTDVQAKIKANKEKLYKLSEVRSSVRKRRSSSRRKTKKLSRDDRRENSSVPYESNNFLRKRKDACIRSSLRNKLAQKNVEMNQRFDREYALTKELTNKCKIYKVQNELYTTSNKNLEISVGQIQQSIEACAKDIIQTEHELLQVKNEIKQDISFINNLKRLTIDTDLNECGVPIDLEKVLKPPDMEPPIVVNATEPAGNVEEMLFVDNIYEFCDNNASMLV